MSRGKCRLDLEQADAWSYSMLFATTRRVSMLVLWLTPPSSRRMSLHTKPLSIAAAEKEIVFPAGKRHKSEEILQKTGKPYQVNLHSSTGHDFAVRCDLSKKIGKFPKEQAFLQAVQWLTSGCYDETRKVKGLCTKLLLYLAYDILKFCRH